MNEETIFATALEKSSADERARFLAEACGGDTALKKRIEALLSAHEQVDDVLDIPADSPGHTHFDELLAISTGQDPARPITEGPGTRIGPYKIVEAIGEGGMGIVFKAEQETPVRRTVALKVIKPGMDTASVVRRFEAERQALALMDHDNIAKVFDAGITDSGRPYFAMELVSGVPITEFCDSGRLSPKDRLELFIPVCQAIQHAHQKGIIHRDIKPTNVIVFVRDGKPVPKVIDFGVAKAIKQRLTERTLFTQFGIILGTPEYMSPEQSQMSEPDIDTRSDVYSLGVLLYELLTGNTPLTRQRLREAAFTEVLRRIREEEPPKPSTRLETTQETASIAALRGTEPARLARLLRGELDWIVMKALEKDRARRYESAGGMARDIKRFLEGEAVEAGPPSVFYRLRVFSRKHRAAIVTAAAFATLLAAAAVVGTWQAIRATRAEQLAINNFKKAETGEAKAIESAAEAEAVISFLRDKILAAGRPVHQDGGLGRDVPLREVIRHAEANIVDRFSNQPRVEARIRDAIGLSYAYMGEYDQGLRQHERARELFESTLGPDAHDTLVSMSSIANVHRHAGRAAQAIPLFQETLGRMDRTIGPNHPHTLATRNNLASLYTELGRTSEAIPVHEQVLAAMKATAGEQHIDTLSSMNNLANAYRNVGRISEALDLHQKTLALMKQTLPPDHPNRLNCMSNLALDYQSAGRLADAIALQEEALKLKLVNPGPDHPDTLMTRKNLAQAYRAAGRSSEAIAILRDILDASTARLGADHPLTLKIRHDLAVTYVMLGQYTDAIPVFERLVELARAKLGSDNSDALVFINDLAITYGQAERPADAVRLHEEGVKTARAKLGPDHPLTLTFLTNLGSAYRDLGKFDDAIRCLSEAVERRKAKLGAEDSQTLQSTNGLIAALLDARRFGEAETLARACSAARAKGQPQDWQSDYTLSQLGGALAGQQKFDEAEPLLRQGYEGMKAKEKSIPLRRRREIPAAAERLAAFFEARKMPDKAAEWRAQARGSSKNEGAKKP